MPISIIDLMSQYATYQEAAEAAVLRVLRSGHYILGPEGALLEKTLAESLGVKYAIAVNSGTTALHLALVAADIGPGDEVITTPFTFIATAEAISYTGATPVFVDIEPDTYCIDPAKIKEKITSKTQAILPVHLYGHSANMYEIEAIADNYDLVVIEDCAQSIGTEYQGKNVGGIGDLGCFSFFPTKNLGTAGEGGLITTNNDDYYEKLLALRVHGSKQRYEHELIGFNARLNEIQAAVLNVKLKYLNAWNHQRQRHAETFAEMLKPLPVKTPVVAPYSNHTYHQYAVTMKNRDRVLEYMIAHQIYCAVHYPKPIHLQKAYAFMGLGEGSFPVSEQLSKEVMSLPVYPELSPTQITEIVKTLRDALLS